MLRVFSITASRRRPLSPPRGRDAPGDRLLQGFVKRPAKGYGLRSPPSPNRVRDVRCRSVAVSPLQLWICDPFPDLAP